MDTTLPPGAPLPFSMPDLTGRSLGPYRILEMIGRGGMATVYKAYQPGTERLVALKVMLHHFTQDSLAVQRFRQETQVIAGLEHRNIVPVYDSGQQDDILYLVMRYLRAGTVQDIIARGPLSTRDALSIISDVAAALDYAHERNVIHRDIKPNNIMVDNEGHAYLTDFGLAKVLGAGGELTNTSMTMGTPAYMAPEQAMGRPVTPQADIYALGVMLYEMLTGEPPFQADSPMAVALMHIQQALRPPRQVNPSISPAAELVILRAMAKEPTDRYQTAGEMARALAQAAESEIQTKPAQLALVAEEIAETKGVEEITPEVRRQLQKQDQQARRKRLLALAPWMVAGFVIIGLAAALLLTFNANAGSSNAAGQTATAITLLLDQLSSAQTAVAAGGSGLEPTLQYLQTGLAGVPVSSTPGPASLAQTATPGAAKPASATPIQPKDTQPAATSLPAPTNTKPPVPTLKVPTVRAPTLKPVLPTKKPPLVPTRRPTLQLPHVP